MIAERTHEQRANPHTSRYADAHVSLPQRLARHALLERYLLGRLDEGARAVLRASAIANPHVFAEVRETELDLLDALAGGTLDRDRARVVRAWLTFTNRVSWPVAQALAEHATRRMPAGEVGATGLRAAAPAQSQARADSAESPRVLPFPLVEPVGARWRTAERAPHPFSSQLQMWPAAAMLVIAAGLWFARNPGAPLVGPPVAPAAVTATASASMPAITLNLSADAPGATTRRLRLAPGTSRLRIEVALPSDMPSPVDITLQKAEGRVLWTMRQARVGSSVVTLSIPADALAKGLLSLVVTPSDGSRPPRRTSFFLE